MEGQNPVVVTYHPTQRQFYLFSDPGRHRSALVAGRVGHLNSGSGKAPKPLSDWTVGELEAWLNEHQHATPEG